MTDTEQKNMETTLRDQEARASRSAFERAWVESLKIKAATFAHIPASALAYEMAWHGYKAGKATIGANGASNHTLPPLESWVPLKFRFGSWSHCFYCGEFPESQDHIVPRSMMRSWVDLRGSGGSPGPKTPACLNCNAVLSDHFFDTLHARCDAINERLVKRFGREVSRPDWTPTELAALDEKLRKHVVLKQEKKSFYKRRIEWQKGESFTLMFNEAYAAAIVEFPENEEFKLFMEPRWRK
tara:strand:+ start:273 stop:995 length:723 start_codon:yes stop_codon:yes gene_type:complete